MCLDLITGKEEVQWLLSLNIPHLPCKYNGEHLTGDTRLHVTYSVIKKGLVVFFHPVWLAVSLEINYF